MLQLVSAPKTQWERFGTISYLEAMASNLEVVASNLQDTSGAEFLRPPPMVTMLSEAMP